jgi:cobalt-zinc-cadmium resistance protein CzcA
MIDRLIIAALRFRAGVIVAACGLVAAGLWAFAHLRLDAFPDLMPNQVDVLADAPGLSPNDVENLITYPIEAAIRGLPGVARVRSISKAGLSDVTVTFNDDVDVYFARTQVQQRMQDAANSLPEGIHPMLGPAATPMGEIFQYLVESDSASLIDLRNLQEYTIAPVLRTIPGVADISTWGGMAQEFQVAADATRLAAYGLTLDDVDRALDDNNANFGAGYIESRGERLTIRGLGRVADARDIGQVVVATRGGTPILVRDVAAVSVGPMPREGAVSRDARGEALSVRVIMLKGGNSREVVTQVEAQLAVARGLLPPGVSIRPFYSQGDVIDHTTATVFHNLLEGGLLVVLILFAFLRNVRASLITASVIPLALLAAFVAMEQFGVSANLMSLGALDFGLLVDASVVMVENFVRRAETDGDVPAGDRLALFRAAALEVGRPVVFGVCIIVAVYIPILSLQGLEGRMFEPMAFTVCVAVVASLLLALTFVPALASLVMARTRETPARWFEAVKRTYVRVLDWSLAHRAIVVAAAAVVLAVALGSVPFLGTEFMPRLDEGSLLIETRRPPSTSLAQGVAMSNEVERTLLQFPEVQSVVTNLGRPEMSTETMGLYQADVYVNFKPDRRPRADQLDGVIDRMDHALASIPGLDYDFSAPMAMRLDEAISGVRTALGVKVFGDDPKILEEKANEISGVIESIPGAADVFVDASAGAMQLEMSLDRTALARDGLSVADVRRAVETGVGGRTSTEVIDGRRRFPVVVRLAAAQRETPDAIGDLLLTSPTGARVRLADVAALHVVEAQERIEHENGERVVAVESNVRGRDLGGFAADVQREVAKRVSLPKGYLVTYGGQFENQQRAMRRLSLIVPAVLAVILGVLYTTFGTFRQAVLIMLNVPFALVGGIAALWARGLNLNLSASVGFIALFGVAVLNGVVLLSYVNQLRASGQSLMDAVRTGATVRLRPVVMTALVASVGFFPMAMSTSQGAEVQRPLATVVIGGLVTSTVLTLLVLPVLYAWVEGRKRHGGI